MDNKRCPKCSETKLVSEFSKHANRKDGLQSICKDCKRKTDRESYTLKQADGTSKVAERNKKAIARARKFVIEYLESHSCVDCGENNILVLEFDHVRGVKKYNVATMVTHGVEAIVKEIAKCEVRCSNCHKKVTHERANTTKWQYLQGLLAKEEVSI